MRKFIFLIPVAMLAFSSVAMARTEKIKDKAKTESAVKKELQNHFKLYGFIRNYFVVDTRESVSGTGDLFYYLPKDVSMNEDGSMDLNKQASFRFLSLTSRVGMDVTGYSYGKTSFGAKVEGDFYAGLSGSSGTATFRLRQAYMTLGWNDLEMGKSDSKASVLMKIGQTWHPMAADQPNVLGLETGAPFNPFSRTPMVSMDASLGKNVVISAAAIWQMQYLSTGPSGATADYIKYAGTPEGYVGFTVKSNNGFVAKAGATVLSIKPRRIGKNSSEKTVRVSDRITTVSPYVFLQYKHKLFEIKAKTVYSQAGEHLSLMSGYGVTEMFDDGHWEYAPLQTSSTWASMSYGKKWQFMMMGGYIKNLGASKDLVNRDGAALTDYIYFNKNGFMNLVSMWRVVPSISYNAGKFTVALEYNLTAAQYGRKGEYNCRGLATEDLHWVYNNRVVMMLKYNF